MALSNSILAWNANSLNASRQTELAHFVSEFSPLCIFILEAKQPSDSSPLSIPGYTSFAKPFLDRQSGILAFVKSCVRCVRRSAVEASPHVLALEIGLARGQRLLALGCYAQQAAGADGRKQLHSSLANAVRTNLPVLALGDFNASHQHWGSSEANSNGRSLLALAEELDLVVLNAIYSHGIPTHGGSVIDLALSNAPQLLIDMSPDDSLPLHSDHVPIRVDLAAAGAEHGAQPDFTRWNTQSHNWPLFATSLDSFMESAAARILAAGAGLSLQDQVDAKFASFYELVFAVARRAIGRYTVRAKPQRSVRLSAAGRAQRDRFHAAHRAYYKHKAPALRDQYHAERALWRATLKAEREAEAEKRYSELAAGGANGFWKFYRRSSPTEPFPINAIDLEGKASGSPADVLDGLAEHFAAQCRSSERKRPEPEEKRAQECFDTGEPARAPHADLDAPFAVEAVLAACRSAKVNVATGPDDFSPYFLRHLGPIAAHTLTDLLNFSWQSGLLPTIWRQANIVPILKKGGNKSSLSSYRGISLTSVLCKLFERLILKRLWGQVGHRITAKQAGFRAGYSTSDQLFRLLSAASPSVRAGRQRPAAFLDISKAFDRTWHAGLMYKLQGLGVTGHAWAWIRSFLSGRQVRAVNTGLCSQWHDTVAGVPQGSVLSPFLFLVYINDLVDCCYDTDCSLYADDVALWPLQEGKEGAAALQRTLDAVSRWALKWRLEFNLQKCAVLWFRKQAVLPAHLTAPFTLSGGQLDAVDQFQFLGLHFSHDLCWKAHTEDLIRRVRGEAFAICKLILSHGGPRPSVIAALVKAVVCPTASYGMPVLQPPLQLRPEIDKWLAYPLRRALRLPPSVSVQAVLSEAGCLGTDALLKRAALAFAQRALTLSAEHPTAVLWAHHPRNPIKSEVDRAEAALQLTAMEHDNKLTVSRLLETQQNALWPVDDSKEPSPWCLVRVGEYGLAPYLRLDPGNAAARRARLRFQRFRQPHTPDSTSLERELRTSIPIPVSMRERSLPTTSTSLPHQSPPAP